MYKLNMRGVDPSRLIIQLNFSFPTSLTPNYTLLSLKNILLKNVQQINGTDWPQIKFWFDFQDISMKFDC